jgi:hypothetical protein
MSFSEINTPPIPQISLIFKYLPISSWGSGHCGEETANSKNRHELHETILFSPRAWAGARRWPMRGLRSNAGFA